MFKLLVMAKDKDVGTVTKKQEIYPNARQKLFGRYLAMQEISPDDESPWGKTWKEYTERELYKHSGYKNGTSTIVKKSEGVQLVLRKYLTHTNEAEDRIKAKALRNIDTGLDTEDENKKIRWTEMAVKREEADKKRTAPLTVNAESVNMCFLLGIEQ